MSFEIIPQAPRYEMNSRGVLRNRETGKILKWQLSKHNSKQMTLRTDDGKKIIISQPHMLWLLHGEITSKTRPVPVVIKKGTRSISFDSLKQCAVFLDEVTHLTFWGAWYHLTRRHKHVGDWEVHYCY
ncbi:MAG: hypothetical protein IJK81_13620 [Selenomonadaceae bacterium]|nr:hypothetical protein [Selenomonadaceae bacterium]